MAKKYIPTDEELEQILSLYNNGMSLRQMETKLHKTRKVLSRILKENEIHIRMTDETSRKYTFNENYFEKIDNEHKAYWLGFMYADGFIETKRNNGNQKFGITLSKEDKSHLEKFKQDLNATYEIKDYQGSGFNKENWFSRLLITSQKTVDDLKKLGCVEQKTKILKFPTEDQVPREYQLAFIRGYLDGDGTIYKDNTNDKYMFGMIGTQDVVTKIHDILKLEVGIFEEHPERCQGIYSFHATCIKYYKSFCSLYDNATIYLERKYELYKIIKEKYSES